ncbi:MAG: (2Fe-2S)-binding protein [Candidatus Jordarchaeaceae archaeon]
MTISFILNGRRIKIELNPNETLLNCLRQKFGMTSVKKGCELGECGACTVLVNGSPLRSCLMLAIQAEGCEVTTVEGLSEIELHPIQKAFIEKNAYQCGYCTPGMILATKALLDRTPFPTPEKIKEWLEGHLCRCTGYEQIIEAVLRASEIIRENIYGQRGCRKSG